MPSPTNPAKSSTNASIADVIAAFLINPSITAVPTVAAPIPYFVSSRTCCEFLKLAANTSVFKPLF